MKVKPNEPECSHKMRHNASVYITDLSHFQALKHVPEHPTVNQTTPQRGDTHTLPSQCFPSPLNPALHVHLYEPWVV